MLRQKNLQNFNFAATVITVFVFAQNLISVLWQGCYLDDI